jgi:hypothetical protein
VTNQIEVIPPSASDEKLRLAEYSAIYGDFAMEQYQRRAIPPIHIIVKSGAVILEGTVASEMDKAEAFRQASAVDGVVSLSNHLRVDARLVRPI